jgi:diketogulonate reductase-like aldo/keto reductase
LQPDCLVIPFRIGLGTYGLGERAEDRERDVGAVRHALDVGYRVIDTAEIYGHGGAERVIGEASRAFGRRSELFIVSKVHGANATYDGTLKACAASIERMGCGYIDLYLLHGSEPRRFSETLRGFSELLRTGLVRHIGVSNFSVQDLEEWRSLAQGIGIGSPLACNQVPYSADSPGIEYELLPYQRQRGIQTMAYSPLGRGTLASHPTLVRLGEQRGLTAAQMALAWCIRDPDIVAIPKSNDDRRIEENLTASSVRLSHEEVEEIDRACGPSLRWLRGNAFIRRARSLGRRVLSRFGHR